MGVLEIGIEPHPPSNIWCFWGVPFKISDNHPVTFIWEFPLPGDTRLISCAMFISYTYNMLTLFISLSYQMDSVDSSDNDKELTTVRGKGFKSPGKLFTKKSSGEEGTETASS